MSLFGRNRQWKRSKDLFAKRVEARNARGVLVKKVTIEPGTIALRIEGGIYRGFLGPGVYKVDDILPTRLENRVTLVLVDSAEVRLDFKIRGLKTGDQKTVCATGVFVVQILKETGKKLLFLENFLQPNTEVSCAEIYERVQRPLEIALSNVLANYDARDLTGNYCILDDIEERLVTRVNDLLNHSGLYVSHLDHVIFKEDLLAQIPLGIVDPEDEEDVETVIGICRYIRRHL